MSSLNENGGGVQEEEEKKKRARKRAADEERFFCGKGNGIVQLKCKFFPRTANFDGELALGQLRRE